MNKIENAHNIKLKKSSVEFFAAICLMAILILCLSYPIGLIIHKLGFYNQIKTYSLGLYISFLFVMIKALVK
jgi:phosphoglycerol transferase MdoB-like AlkP superfamily enzyme